MAIRALVQMIRTSTQHQTLYHFTDEANFPTIAEHGILSKVQLRRRGVTPAAFGGDDLSRSLDAARGIDAYVSLCMTRNHGMKFLAQQAGRLPNARYLAISPEVLFIPETKIAFGVANSNDVEILPIEDAIEKLDTKVLYTRTDWNDQDVQSRLRAAEKFEVLVPDRVPPELIVGKY